MATKSDLVDAMEEAEERYNTNCYTPQRQSRGVAYADAVTRFVATWIENHIPADGWPECAHMTDEWREEMAGE